MKFVLWFVLLGWFSASAWATPTSAPATRMQLPTTQTAQRTTSSPQTGKNSPTSKPVSLAQTSPPPPVQFPPKLGRQRAFGTPPRRDLSRLPQSPNMPKWTSLSRSSFFWSQVIGMLFALGFVVMFIYVLMRWLAGRMGISGPVQSRTLRVCERLSLEPKKGLWLVEAADHYLLLATHEHGVTLLERIEIDAIEQAQQRQPKGEISSSFWSRLQPKQKESSPTQHPNSTSISPSQEHPTPEMIPTQFEVVSDGKQTSVPDRANKT